MRRARRFADLTDDVLRRRARPARRPLPVARSSPSCGPASCGTGSADTRAGPRRRPAAGRHQRRHHPRPRPVRRVPARRHPGRRARRGDGLREPAGRDVPARRVAPGASRTSPSSGSSSRRRRASRARCRSGTATGRAGRSSSAGRSARSCARSGRCRRRRRVERLRDRLRPRRAGRRQPGAVPRRAGRGHRRRARRPHHRRRALPRRDRRLAGVRALAVRRAGARAVGDGDRAPADRALRAWRSRRCGATTASSSACPRRSTSCPLDELLIDPDEIDELVVVDAAADRRCSRPASGSARPGRCCCPAAGPTGARRCGSSASGPPTCWRWRPSTRRFPILLEATPRVPARRVRPAGPARGARPTCAAAQVRVVSVDTPKASPFAQSLLFGWIAAYMYEGDAPLAERRAAALALDRDLLRELLGAEELRELLDPGVLADLELELQRLADGRRARERRRAARPAAPARRPLADRARPAVPTAPAAAGVARRSSSPSAAPSRCGSAGEERVAAAEDAARYRDALGVRPPARPAGGLHRAGRRARSRPRRALRPHPRPVPRRRGRPPLRRSAPSASPARCGALEAEGRVVRGEFRPDGVEREWCDDDVLRQLRRRSLAALRREVEPVEPEALARFLPGLAGHRPSHRRGLDDAGRGARRCCRARRSSASVLEPDVLPGARARLPARPTSTRCAPRASWCGSAPARSGATDGRVRLSSATSCRCSVAGAEDDGAARRCRSTRRSAPHLAAAGRVVLDRAARAAAPGADRRRAARRAVGPGVGGRGHQRLAGAAAGVPERRPGRRPVGRRAGRPGAPRGRPRPGRLSTLGPAGRAPGGGRWSRRCSNPARRPTELAHATALQLLERHGVLTREAVLAEGVEGGFAGVYGVLKALEERGQVRRGYFVAGLGAAQFALPGAVDRLRSDRGDVSGDDPGQGHEPPLVLAATDPAQPYGAALAWPDSEGRPARAAGALVVLSSGRLLAWLDRRGHHLVTFPSAAERHQLGRCPRRAGQGRSGAGPGDPQGGRSAGHRRAGDRRLTPTGGFRRQLPRSGPQDRVTSEPCPRVTPSIGPPQRFGPRCWRRS